MAIEPVSYSMAGLAAGRPPDPMPDARQAVEQQNDANRIAEADSGASPQYVNAPQTNAVAQEAGAAPAAPAGGGSVGAGAVVDDPEGSIQRAQTLIQTVNSNGAPSEADTRRAAEAYQAASSAQAQIAQQQQGQGSQTLDVLA
jgi:hypothetical protein